METGTGRPQIISRLLARLLILLDNYAGATYLVLVSKGGR
jgi:hypothetical protein